METKFIEACNILPNGKVFNWGKFAVCRFDAEELARPAIEHGTPAYSLVGSQGWGPEHIWVLDLATGEGACFKQGGYAHADLEKHRIWVCPLFEPFLGWLYKKDLSDFSKLPDSVEFNTEDAPPAYAGYRRPGPPEAQNQEAKKEG